MAERKGSIGASDLMRELRSDPIWTAQEKARNEWISTEAARLTENQRPILADLESAGWEVATVWDLVNTSDSYPEAIPILIAHLDKPYDSRIREGIVRGLTVPEARGEPARRILQEFGRSGNDDKHVRWALANALTVVADQSMIAAMEELLIHERDESVRRLLQQAIVKAKKRMP